jgi:3-oxoacyl-[acyl-carrier protein] reductase
VDKRLEGKVAVVTGASRGIGKAIAEVYAAHGASVLVAYRSNDEAAQRTVDGIRAAGGEATAFRGDVSRTADTEAMAAAAVRHYGSIDILCANAVIYPAAPIERMTEEMWDDSQAVNLKGTFLAVKACVPQMKSQHYGRIVVVSSTSGARVGLNGAANYGAAKAGQIGFLLCACLELAEHNVTINAILPGWVATESLVNAGQERLDMMAREIPLRRLADPLDVAHGALFLSSDEASYITGQTLVIDGGLLVPEVPSQLR